MSRVTLVALAAALLLLGTAGTGWANSLLYPDLRSLPPRQLRFAQEPIGDAVHHVLRFSATVWNAGQGPLEVRGDPSIGGALVYQRIYDDQGGVVEREAGKFIKHEAHKHWHFENFAAYELWTRDDYDAWLAGGRAQGEPLRRGSKTTGQSGPQGESFCIRDSRRMEGLPGSPETRTYADCDRELQGVSVGWADIYQYYLPEQWIDLGDAPLPDGRYVARVVADPLNLLYESAEGGDPGRESQVVNEAATFFTVRGDRIRIPGD